MLILCVSCQDKDYKLENGQWYAEFTVGEQKIPFIFEVENAETDSASVYLINGIERVALKGITYNKDTITIPIEAYDTKLIGIISGSKIEGRFIKAFLDNDSGVPFIAKHSDDARFKDANKHITAPYAPEGKWDVLFLDEKGDTTNNVGIFAYDKNSYKLTGSILTNTGDMRFLEGVITNSGFKLSAFSGLSPYLIDAVMNGNDFFTGKLYTTRGITNIVGKRNNEARLADPYSLTTLKKGYTSLNFTFPNIDGRLISLADQQYKDKVVVISILGSWCPNCLDEMEFLSPWYKENKDRGVEIIGLAFERKDDPEYVKRVLTRLKNKYDVSYEILFAGMIGSESTTKALPEITTIMSYPTTIFIDKKGAVRKIHTGFNGPATGLFYEEFKTDFNKLIDSLLEE